MTTITFTEDPSASILRGLCLCAFSLALACALVLQYV